jgi:hypothetical protein
MIKHTVIAVALALAFGGPALAAGEAHGHGPGAEQAKLTLNHGKKWQTDAPLRQGMENMRAALAGDLKTIHADKASAKQYEALAAKLEGEVAYVVQNCKLDPEADAQLHLVVAEVLGGAEAMKGKEQGVTRRAGTVRVVKALNEYGKYFDHPGWRKL